MNASIPTSIRSKTTSMNLTTITDQDPQAIVLDTALCNRTILPLPDMQRHTIAFGESGSGKTVTVVAPLAKSFLVLGDLSTHWASIVMIDPKRELGDLTRSLLASRGQQNRLMEIGVRPFDLFEGLAQHPLTQRAELLRRLAFEMPRIGENSMWICMAQSLFDQLVKADGEWYRAKGHQGDECLFADLMCTSESDQAPRNRMHCYMLLLQSLMQRDNMLRRASTEIRRRLAEVGLPASLDPLVNYIAEGELVKQFAYLTQILDPMLRTLSSSDLYAVLDCDPVRTRKSHCVSIGRHLDAGGVVLYQPPSSMFKFDQLVGRTLKSACFRHAFARAGKRPMAYVCDEFHRYVTADEDSGEQNFLDRCRAFGVSCILATQSIAALKSALLQRGHNSQEVEVAVQSILNNTATKYFLRTTDLDTRDHLRSMLPECPRAGMRHVIEVRPPVTLKTGEAYFFLPDGTSGRSQSPESKLIRDLLTRAPVHKANCDY